MVVLRWFLVKARHLWPVFTVVSSGDGRWNKDDARRWLMAIKMPVCFY
ncbi:hypothetical protein Lser_V15G27831 [Lactuca serriola]